MDLLCISKLLRFILLVKTFFAPFPLKHSVCVCVCALTWPTLSVPQEEVNICPNFLSTPLGLLEREREGRKQGLLLRDCEL